ncbi:MAG: vanadium-dependent haloperoxidase [Rhodothermales bacterium]
MRYRAVLSTPRIALVLSVVILPAVRCNAQTEAGPSAEPIVEWNRVVLEIAEAEDGFLTLKGLRTVTMMHLAMHDAMNAIVHRYEPYEFAADDPDADLLAAANTAAYTVAAQQYPGSDSSLAALRVRLTASERETSPSPTRAAIERGEVLGRAAAEAIVRRRVADGWDAEAEYSFHPMGPGVYAEFNKHSGTPEGFVFGAGWGAAQPFSMDSSGQFRVPPPPDIKSAAYTAAFNEVKEVGRYQTIERTVDQTHLALWWKDFNENSQNRLARDLIQKEPIDAIDANRLFALVNVGVYDGYISSFNNKFFYNHWRPYTAIRWADNDENPDTEKEANWTNLHRHTYAFPSYPSAHGTACGGAAAAFEDVFGDGYGFMMRIPLVDIAGPMSGKIEMHPATRTFDSFEAAAIECGLSRLYLGIHFRYDSEQGVRLGYQVGRHAVATILRPVG